MSPEKPRFSFPLARKNFRNISRENTTKKCLPQDISMQIVDGDIVLTSLPIDEIKQEEGKKETNPKNK